MRGHKPGRILRPDRYTTRAIHHVTPAMTSFLKHHHFILSRMAEQRLRDPQPLGNGETKAQEK